MSDLVHEDPYIDDFDLETSPDDHIVKYGYFFSEEAILYCKPNGFHYAIVKKEFSGLMAVWWEPDETVHSSEIGPKTRKRVEEVWDREDRALIGEIKKITD